MTCCLSAVPSIQEAKLRQLCRLHNHLQDRRKPRQYPHREPIQFPKASELISPALLWDPIIGFESLVYRDLLR